MLSDKEIRAALKNRLENSVVQYRVMVDELRINDGVSIADLVSISSFLHCYEIKSDRDSLSRLSNQIEFYNETFKRITLVTTQKHLNPALEKIPNFWGVVVASVDDRGGVKFRYKRRAENNKSIKVSSCLRSLWRSELSDIYLKQFQRMPPKSFSREAIVESLSGLIKPNKAIEYMTDSIYKRSSNIELTMKVK